MKFIPYAAFALSLITIIALSFSFYWVPKLIPTGFDSGIATYCNKLGGNDVDFIPSPQGCPLNGTTTPCAVLVCAQVK